MQNFPLCVCIIKALKNTVSKRNPAFFSQRSGKHFRKTHTFKCFLTWNRNEWQDRPLKFQKFNGAAVPASFVSKMITIASVTLIPAGRLCNFGWYYNGDLVRSESKCIQLSFHDLICAVLWKEVFV